MKQELELKLQAKYPKLFEDLYGPMDKTCMHWGIAVGDGWYDLVDETCSKIVSLDPAAKFTQIKEKWGRMRIYVESEVEGVWDIINKAEEASSIICESCSAPAKLSNRGWLSVQCDDCIKAKKK